MPRHLSIACGCAVLAASGCAVTTTSVLIPAPQAPVCDDTVKAAVLWAPKWRLDQKDAAAREAAAAEGLGRFFAQSGCFEAVSLLRLPDATPADIQPAAAAALARGETVVVIALRELGPTVKLGASLALVEGGTEVVFDLTEFRPAQAVPRSFTVQWRSGGPGVVKGVATLAHDLQAALAAGLQPGMR